MDGWAMDGFIDIRFAPISLNFELCYDWEKAKENFNL
jgi:hypothetical protein